MFLGKVAILLLGLPTLPRTAQGSQGVSLTLVRVRVPRAAHRGQRVSLTEFLRLRIRLALTSGVYTDGRSAEGHDYKANLHLIPSLQTLLHEKLRLSHANKCLVLGD